MIGYRKLSAGQSSARGQHKPCNADAVGSFLPPDPRWWAAKGALFVLADGVNGWQSGHLVAQSAIQYLLYAYYADPSPQLAQALVQAMQATNAWLYAWASRYPAHHGLGTTLVAVVVRENQAVVASVGDSRAYLIRNGYPYRITRDHRWVAEAVAAGGLTPEQAQRHPWRNVLSRAVGTRPEVAVDVFLVDLQPGDTLALCSDGLWERVRGQEMGSLARQYPPAEAARRLVALARARGEPDDITALIVRWEAPRPAVRVCLSR